MGFNSIFKSLKTAFKPGLNNIQIAGIDITEQNTQVVDDGNVIDPRGDSLGNLWTRDADNPIFYNPDNAGVNKQVGVYGYLTRSVYTGVGSQQICYLSGVVGAQPPFGIAIYEITALQGAPGTDFAVSPVYLQIWKGGAAVGAGTLIYAAPVNVPPSHLHVSFSPRAPLQMITQGGIRGWAAFSSTYATYTSGPTGTIFLSWAPAIALGAA